MSCRLPKRPRLPIAWAVLLLSTTGTVTSATETLSILTYNIHAGIPMGRSSKEYVVTSQDLQNLADVITSSGADLVALQEVHCELGLGNPKRQPTSALNEARLLSAGTGMDYLFASTLDDKPGYPPNTGYLEWGNADQWTNNGVVHGEFGNAMLSRYPWTQDVENVPLPRRGNDEQRAALRVKLRDVPIVVYAVHLQHDHADSRHQQIEALLDRASQESSGTIVFIAGDLNSRDDSPAEKVLAAAARRNFVDLAGEFAVSRGVKADRTFPSDKPDRRIDYILCNQPLEVRDAQVIPVLTSDHLPLLVTVELPSGPRP